METVRDKQALAAFRTSDGLESHATVLKAAPFAATLEVYHPEAILQASESLNEFQMHLGDRPVYAGRAVVKQLVQTGSTLLCEVQLDTGGFDPGFFPAIQRPDQLRERFKHFMNKWRETSRILPEYKLVVADMQSFLSGLQQWLEQVELGIRAAPSGDRFQMERSALTEVSRVVLPEIDQLFERFESTTPALAPENVPAHLAYMKKNLHPLMLCSPFAYRTFSKPLGYAGDYEMVAMMLRDPFEGGSVFAKVLNRWFLEQPPALAHRNRITDLQRLLTQEVLRVSSLGRKARVLNLACGPAVEVQRFLQETHLSNQAQFELLDFNSETLSHVKRVLEEIKRRHERSTLLSYINKPVHQLLRQGAKTIEQPPERQYDFIYCAGLFDYLTDPVCHRLIELLYSWLSHDGLLLVTNVDQSNPLRYGMEHLLDWHLIYRTGTQLRSLKPAQVPIEDAQVRSDFTGVNLFLEIRKHRNA